MKQHWTEYLRQMGACDEALEWCAGFKTPESAWRNLHKADDGAYWLFWLADHFVDVSDECIERIDMSIPGSYDGTKWHLDDACRDYLGGDTWSPEYCAYVRSAFPTPTLADLKRAAKGELVWELTETAK